MFGFKVDFEKRIFGFDLLRAFAIFCVVHGHSRHLLQGTLFEKFPWFRLPHGVDIFFVLSGFLIGYSFIANAHKTGGRLTVSKAFNFWKRSALRILPNYYLLLLINYLLVKHEVLNGSTDFFNIWKFITFTQNLWYPFYDFFWESWSLATQEWFYLLFPILLMILSVKFKIKYLVPIISVGFILSSIWYRVQTSSLDFQSFWWDVTYRKVALSRFDCIYFGVLAAWFRFYFRSYWSKYAKPLFVVGLILFVLTFYIPTNENSLYTKVFYLSIIPIYISLWFPLLDKLKDVKTVLGKLITYFSILSYAMYLLNLLLIQIVDKHFANLWQQHATLKYLIFWLVTIACSYILYAIFEKPISSFGNKVLHTTKMMYKKMGVSEK